MIRQRRSGVATVKKIALNNNGNDVDISQHHHLKVHQQGTTNHSLKKVPKRIADPRDLQDQGKQNNSKRNTMPVRRVSAYQAPKQNAALNGHTKSAVMRRKSAPAMISDQQLKQVLKGELSEDERMLLAAYRLQHRHESPSIHDPKQNHFQTEKDLKKSRRVSFLAEVEEHHLEVLQEEKEDA